MILKDWKTGLELKSNKSTISANKYQEKPRIPMVIPSKSSGMQTSNFEALI